MTKTLTGIAKRLRNELASAATRGTLRLTYGQFGDLVGIPPVFFECNRTETHRTLANAKGVDRVKT
ncbi:hypothetical protein J2Z50_003382 [Ensifer mexicanus]|nr:hypothetical protein [Sinorhizobium mexicanum]